MKQKGLITLKEFEILKPFVHSFNKLTHEIEFVVPRSFAADEKKITTYLDNAEMQFTSGSPVYVIKGRMIYDELFSMLTYNNPE